MKKIKSLPLLEKTILITSIVTVFIFICLIPLFFFNWMEIPLGILLGGLSGVLCFALFLLAEKKEKFTRSLKFSITAVVLMSVIHILVLTFVAILTYVLHLHIFNLFATFGSIFIAPITFVICNLKEGDKK